MSDRNSLIASFLFSILWVLILKFAIPMSAISTLMHAILKLPGPGAGIGMIYAPIFSCGAALVCLISNKKQFSFFIYFGVMFLFAISFPIFKLSPIMLLKFFILFILLARLAMIIYKRNTLKYIHKMAIFSGIASYATLIYYWFLLFPNTEKGMVKTLDAVVLLGTTLPGVILIGILLPHGIIKLFGVKDV